MALFPSKLNILLIIICIIKITVSQTPPGIVKLDGYSFSKVIDGTRNVLVKFDEFGGYGEPSQVWESLGYELQDFKDILLVEISLNLYGDEDEYGMGGDMYDEYGMGGMDGMGGGGGGSGGQNDGIQELFDEYNIEADDLPQYRLFKKKMDVDNPVKFVMDNDVDVDGEYTSHNLLQWIQSNGVYLGLEGCIKDFDELIKDFIDSNGNQIKRDEIGKKSKNLLTEYNEKDDNDGYKSAKYYIKVMAKIIANGNDWVNKEGERLGGILMSNNVNKKKRKWFTKRLNILSSFSSVIEGDNDKDEL